MKTIVEFLRENLLIGNTLSNGDVDFNNYVFELAEKIEEQQILDAWKEGLGEVSHLTTKLN